MYLSLVETFFLYVHIGSNGLSLTNQRQPVHSWHRCQPIAATRPRPSSGGTLEFSDVNYNYLGVSVVQLSAHTDRLDQN